MRLLIDSNVLLDVALQRPGAPSSARVHKASPVPALNPDAFLRKYAVAPA